MKRSLARTAPLCALTVLALACSDADPGAPPWRPPPGDAHWQWENPLSLGASIWDVWGGAPDDMWAVGDSGLVLHYDGATWTRVPGLTDANIHGIHGTSTSRVVAVGSQGTLLRFDGATWSDTALTAFDLFDVWAGGSGEVVCVGFAGTVARFDGSDWQVGGIGIANQLGGVWGSAGSDVYATGIGPDLLHFDGAQWDTVDTGAALALTDVWGTGASDVFAVGAQGTIVRYNGAIWSDMSVGGFSNFFQAVWGASSTDVFAVGLNGVAWHYDGAWSPMSAPFSRKLFAVFGAAGGDVFAVGLGGAILLREGDAWRPAEGGVAVDLAEVWAGPSGGSSRIWAAGDFGSLLAYDGAQWASVWSLASRLTDGKLASIHGASASNVIIAGDRGTILRLSR
jgi:hypothetical protein